MKRLRNRNSGDLVGRREFVSCTVPHWQFFRNLKKLEVDDLRKRNDLQDQTVVNLLLADINTTISYNSPCHQLSKICWHGILSLVKTNNVIALSDNYRDVSDHPSNDTLHGTVYDHLQHIGCNLTDTENNNLLHIAAESGKTAMARYLLTESNYPINERGKHGRSPVLMATYCGHLEMMKVLIGAGCDLFLVDANHNNALHLASSGGSLEVVEFLLSRKSLFDSHRRQKRSNDNGFARKRGHRRKGDEKYLGQRRRISNATFKFHPEQRKDHQMVKMRVHDVPTKDDGPGRSGLTSDDLYLDVSEKRYRRSFRRGFDIESRGILNRTAVMLAASFGHADVYYALTNHKCNLFLTDILGCTTLHLAAKGGDRGIVTDLLANNLNIESKDNDSQTPVFLAVYFGNIKVIKLLMTKKCKIKVVDKYGDNLLHIAAMTDNTATMNYVLSLGFDLESKTTSKVRTPLMISARKGNLKTFELLYMKGSNPLATDKSGRTLIHMAAMSGHTEMVDRVLLLEKQYIDSKDHHGRTPILSAARRGHTRMISYLIMRGANFTASDIDGHNILHIAAIWNQKGVAAYLLSKGVGIDSRDNYGKTPMMVAGQTGQTSMVDFLLNKGANVRVTDKGGQGLLHVAAIGDQVRAIKQALDKGISIESKDVFGKTPLMSAAQMENMKAIRYLVRRGADIHARNKAGDGLMHMAAMRGRLKVLKFLLDKKMKIDDRGHGGRTPAMKAASYGELETLQFLIAKGCNLQATDDKRNTILHVACETGNLKILKYLLSRNMDINSKGSSGRTCVAISAEGKRVGIYDFLVDRGANLKVVDDDGNNILHLAIRGGNMHIIKDILHKNSLD